MLQLAVCIGLSAVLIPLHGIMGAAVAVCTAQGAIGTALAVCRVLPAAF